MTRPVQHPGVFEGERELSVASQGQSVLSYRRPGDVPAQSVDLRAIGAVHDLLGVQVDAAQIRDGLIGGVAGPRVAARRRDQPQRRWSRSVRTDDDAASRRLVASGKDRMLELTLEWLCITLLGVQASAVC